MKVQPEVAQALLNLRGSVDFQTVLRWLEDSREREQVICNSAIDDVPLRRAQGAVGVINGVLKAYREAPDTTEKFKNQPSPRQKVNTL